MRGVVAFTKCNSKCLIDVVTVGQLNIFFNEAGCLRMNNLVDCSGIRYTIKSLYTFLAITLMIMVIKEREWLNYLHKRFLKSTTPFIFQFLFFPSCKLIYLLVWMQINWDHWQAFMKISSMSIVQIPFGYLFFHWYLFFV